MKLKSRLFDLEYKIASDRDFIGNILLLSKTVICIEEFIVKFRKNVDSFGDQNSELASLESGMIKNNFIKKVKIIEFLMPVYDFYDRVIQKTFRLQKVFTER